MGSAIWWLNKNFKSFLTFIYRSPFICLRKLIFFFIYFHLQYLWGCMGNRLLKCIFIFNCGSYYRSNLTWFVKIICKYLLLLLFNCIYLFLYIPTKIFLLHFFLVNLVFNVYSFIFSLACFKWHILLLFLLG